MAAGRKINPILKMVLELGPIVLFFAGYVKLKDQTFTIAGADYSGFILMTAAFIPLMILTTGILWALTGKLSKMQLATVVLVIVFGGLSVWLNDERFFKMKPTMIYLLFAGTLGFGLLRGESYLKAVMDDALPLQPEGWMILTRRLCAFFFALAVANEAVWRLMSTEAWVNFKTFGLTAALFAFFMTQGGVLARYGIEEPKGDGGA
ncbi:MAG: inner membrane-spanning protein YciB [Pseudomonadota bacterium]